MRTVEQVLDRAKEVQKVRSDYKLGLCLGIGESSLANYRHGRSFPDEKTCAKLAIAMGEDPIILMVEMHAQRSKDDEIRTMWEGLAKRLQKGVASVLLMSLLAIFSIAASALPVLASGLTTSKSVAASVYYVNQGLGRLFYFFYFFVIFGKLVSFLGFSGKKYGLDVPHVPCYSPAATVLPA